MQVLGLLWVRRVGGLQLQISPSWERVTLEHECLWSLISAWSITGQQMSMPGFNPKGECWEKDKELRSAMKSELKKIECIGEVFFFPSYVLSFSHLSWSLASTNQGSNLMDTAVIVLRRMIPFSNCSPPSPYIPVISNWIMMLLCMRRDYSFWRIFTGEIFNCL